MYPETLKTIKQQVSKFYKVYKSLTEYFNKDKETYPELVIVEILLQNISGDKTNTYNYSHEREVELVSLVLSKIKVLNEYYEWYMISWAYNELYFIIDGNIMSEQS